MDRRVLAEIVDAQATAGLGNAHLIARDEGIVDHDARSAGLHDAAKFERPGGVRELPLLAVVFQSDADHGGLFVGAAVDPGRRWATLIEGAALSTSPKRQRGESPLRTLASASG